jgi:hypothetical protein
MAVAALVIKLTEPEPAREVARRPDGADSLRLACAPGLGFSATCALAF